MTDMPKGQALLGQRALVLGIANEHSIAYGCAKVFRALGAELAVTYLNEKAKPYVEPLARDLGAAIIVRCDIGKEGELEALFNRIAETWGRPRHRPALDCLCAQGGSARPAPRQLVR